MDHQHCVEYLGNCSTHSTGSRKDNDCAETFSLGSWKDEADRLSEHAVEESSTSDFIQSAPLKSTPVKKSCVNVAQSPGVKLSWDDVDQSSQVKKSSADMAQEDELEEEEGDEHINKFVNANAHDFTGDGTSPKEAKPKVELSRDHREYICFGSVKRKKDFICLERVNVRIVNVLDGLELHTGVFSAAEEDSNCPVCRTTSRDGKE